MGYVIWMAVIPPPPARCSRCGAEEAAHGPVIPMVPAPATPRSTSTGSLPVIRWDSGDTGTAGRLVVDGTAPREMS